MSDQNNKPKIFMPNSPKVTRLFPELAAEIGLNESILLLQIDFWIEISNNFRDGKYWTYQSVRKIKETFQFWGVATINRTIKSLEKERLIFIGNYNERKNDKTRWFALNPEAINKLKSIKVLFQDETGMFQSGTGSFQNGTDSFQSGTTLPESTETTTEKKSTAPDGAPNPFTEFIEEELDTEPEFDINEELKKHLYWEQVNPETGLYDVEPENIASLISAWFRWCKNKPLGKSSQVLEERDWIRNKGARAAAKNIWSRGVRPADVIHCLGEKQRLEGGRFLEPYPFAWWAKIIEEWVVMDRERSWNPPESPRRTPAHPGVKTISLGHLDRDDPREIILKHIQDQDIIVDVPPPYISPYSLEEEEEENLGDFEMDVEEAVKIWGPV